MEESKTFLRRSKRVKIFYVSMCLGGMIFFSCSKKEIKIPREIISKDTMVMVMSDMHLAEANAQFNRVFDDSKNIKQGQYRFIFEKYKITSAQLMGSWNFYASHPEIFSKIYEEVITELSKKQAEAINAERPKTDSLKK